MEIKQLAKIEKGIPIPAHNGDGTRKYPFSSMEVGDSFLLNGQNPTSVSGAAISFGKAYNRNQKFSVRKTPDGYRCWRVK